MKYKSGYRYVSQEGMNFTCAIGTSDIRNEYAQLLGSVGLLSIIKNYAWDGASFILFTWFGTPEKWLVPSLVHDALYQLMQDGKLPLRYRKEADLLFYQLLRDRGVWWISATVAYYAVRWFGNYFARHGRTVREVV